MAWQAKKYGAYSRDSPEAIENATEIYYLLSSKGWTLNAVCGVLGNMGSESGYNPWRWEGDDVLASTDTDTIATSRTHGYGLVQFTPAGKYIFSSKANVLEGYAPNYSDKVGLPSDGQAQVLFFEQYADYYDTDTYPLSYADFKISTEHPEYLAKAWLYNYERPLDPESTESQRAETANYWYEVLSGQPPPPSGGESTKRKHIPIWYYSAALLMKRRGF